MNYIISLYKKISLASALIFLALLLRIDVNAQQFVNGNLTTGSYTKSGILAPSGYTWSEVQNEPGSLVSNTVNGIGAQITATGGNTVADDFTVPDNQIWNINKLTFFAYQTGYYSSESPFTDLRIRIYNGIPSDPLSEIIFGDLEANMLTETSEAFMYRIPNTITPNGGTAPLLNRRIFKLEAAVNISLSEGTYWVEWQQFAGINSNFTPPSTVLNTRTQPDCNAIQWLGTSNLWIPLIDTGNPYTSDEIKIDMPFIIDYTMNMLNVYNELSNSFSIFPNPVQSTLTIKSAALLDSIELYDAHGRFIKEYNCKSICWQIDLTSINVGIYFLLLKSDRTVATAKVVKL